MSDKSETRPVAELLREIAERDPEGHRRRLAEGYGVGPAHDWAHFQREAISARARGDFAAERDALDALALIEREPCDD